MIKSLDKTAIGNPKSFSGFTLKFTGRGEGMLLERNRKTFVSSLGKIFSRESESKWFA